MTGMISKARNVYVILFILLAVGAVTEPVSAQRYVTVEAKIIPPSPYQVYTSQTYSLTVGVQYDLPPDWYLWIEAESYRSSGATVSGKGVTGFALMLTAPPTPGTYTLTLTLYGQTGGSRPSVMDTASVTYRVIQPIVTDWDVERVWLDPTSPGEGDKATFHMTIALLSTNSKEALTVQVACLLDKRPYYVGSLTFSPQPGKQDVTVPQAWTATKGEHTLTCIVDPNHRHNDPTPYPAHNHKDAKFTVQLYYAVIQSITTSPTPDVMEGELFSVVIRVSYFFPQGATLKVRHQNNQTDPPSEEKVDDVKLTGSGTKDFTFKTRPPFTKAVYGVNLGCAKYGLIGQGFVWFDRGGGAGWEKTDPGWTEYYNVTVRRPVYYALFNQVTAQYVGSANATGQVAITLLVRYLLPIQTGLRITITRFSNATKGGLPAYAWAIIFYDESSLTQPDVVERTATYVYTYSYPTSALSSGTLTFIASVDYLACGAWNHGDEATVSATVPYTPPPKSISDYLIAALQKIWEWSTKWIENLPKVPWP